MDTIESCPALDVRKLNWLGCLTPGKSEPAIGTYYDGEYLRLKREGWPPQKIEVVWSDCYFGGERPWFVCPRCDRRMAILYLRDGAFRCRRCHGLVYRSMLMTGKERAEARARKLREGVGADPDLTRPFAPGDRPKGMRLRTWNAMVDAAWQATITYCLTGPIRTAEARRACLVAGVQACDDGLLALAGEPVAALVAGEAASARSSAE